MPEVWVASCRLVIFDFSGAGVQPAMYFDAGSSGEIRPSLIATASDMPPTSALAIEAVPCGRFASHSGAYHSSAIRPRRITMRPVVRCAARLLRHASSFAASSPASPGEMLAQSIDWPHVNPAQTASTTALFNPMPYSVQFAYHDQCRSRSEERRVGKDASSRDRL